MRTRHPDSGCPREASTFQKDYWKITTRQRQPGLGLRQYHIWGFSLSSVKADFLSKSDKSKAVLAGR